MTAKGQQPDWSRVAAGFDLWLPQLAPVGARLLDALGARPGERVLDVACGTGEPALSLARAQRDVRVTGVDAAEPMVEVARRKAREQELANAEFRTMAAERLDFPDASFDRVVCRFGVMLFDDPLAGVREVRRVLRPGGRFAFAVWSRAELMPNCLWAYEVFEGRIPQEAYPNLHGVTSLGEPERVEQLARAAGFGDAAVTEHLFDFAFEDFDSYWDMVEDSGVMARQYDALPAHERPAIREGVRARAAPYLGAGGLRVPHGFLLAVVHRD
ncbi:MAG: methyltransferase domain-containing protein [Gammaproteobacteria bacterium]|nr:methyltransferase domain-containing protein [Gammaproteobacteria bacterium]